MNKALVIRTFGDPDLCKQVADGWSQQVIPLDTEELDTVRAECEKLKSENGLIRFGDGRRINAACEALDEKYALEYHGPIYWTLLRVWAMIWLGIDNAYRYLSAWNRGELDD